MTTKINSAATPTTRGYRWYAVAVLFLAGVAMLGAALFFISGTRYLRAELECAAE